MTTIVPAAGLDAMTFQGLLIIDYSFKPDRIAGLTVDEQAQCHGAVADRIRGYDVVSLSPPRTLPLTLA